MRASRGGPLPLAAVPSAGGPGVGAGGEAAPYPPAEIEGGGKLAGSEIVWLKDRWEAYVVTVQGSARLRLPDGRILESATPAITATRTRARR